MKYIVLLFAFLISACGGSDPQRVDPAALAYSQAQLEAEKEKALLCNYGCGGIPNADVIFQAGFKENTGSTYYREGEDYVMRFDGPSNDAWVEYSVLSSSANELKVTLTSPGSTPNSVDVATVTFTMSSTGAISSSAVFFTSDGSGSFNKSADSMAGWLGMKPPSLNWFAPGKKMHELIYDPL